MANPLYPENTFEERWALPVEAPQFQTAVQEPVPQPQPTYSLTPVDYDPWEVAAARTRAPYQNRNMASVEPGSVIDKLAGVHGERYQLWPEKIVRSGLSLPHDVFTGEEQFLPLIGTRREDFTDVPRPTGPTKDSTWLGRALNVAPVAAQPLDRMIERTQDLAGLGVTGPLAMRPGTASLGSGAVRQPETIKLYRGEYHGNKGGSFFSPDAEWARQFTQSGLESEVKQVNIKAKDIYDPPEKIYAGDPDKIDAVIKEAKQNGFKAVRLDEGHNQPPSVYVFNKGALFADNEAGTAIGAVNKSINANVPPAPRFYSAVEHAVENGQPKATAEQWLGTIQNAKGVKPDELNWIGLNDFLNENKGKVLTKNEVNDFIQQNKVELKEVQKFNITPEIENKTIAEFTANNPEPMPRTSEWYKWYKEREAYLTDKFKSIELPKYKGYQLPGGPLSRDTEILTRNGWKRIDCVSIGEEIITRKDENGELEWKPIQAVPMVYADKLYHFFNQSIDMQVTANHKMVAKKRRRNNEGLVRITAEQLWNKSEYVIPLTGVWNGKGTGDLFGFDARDVAEFVGWYLAEGSYKHKNGIKNTIQLAQCRIHNPENCDRLEALFDRLNLIWKYYGDAYGIGIKTMPESLKQLLHSQPISEGKYIPKFFFNESKEVIEALLNGLISGDGHTIIENIDNYGSLRQSRRTFFSKSKQLADDVQVLALLTGYRASVRKRLTGIYAVGINLKDWNSVDDSKHAIIDYNDFAYCVTVENHCIYVRRNGVAAFTGNSDYREMLLTLPTASEKNMAAYQAAKQRGDVKEMQRLNAIEGDRLNQGANAGQYTSSHWSEPNVLAHTRVNDRLIDGKKSLHVEEIQSDWHQAGRDKGYKNDSPVAKRQKEIESQLDAMIKDNPQGKTSVEHMKDLEQNDKFIKLREELFANQKAETAERNAVPDAPFKKTWHELALKRLIREAAEKGYERLSWTPGEAQAARYDLSKQVDRIAYDNKGQLLAYGKNGDQIINKKIAETEIADHIGKEAAERLIKAEKDKHGDRVLKNADLKVGGEGMKGFYDNIIPKAVEKLGKEWGVKVQKGEIETTSPRAPLRDKKVEPIHYIDIPPAMRESVLRKGFPLYSSGLPFTFVPVDYNPFEEKQ